MLGVATLRGGFVIYYIGLKPCHKRHLAQPHLSTHTQLKSIKILDYYQNDFVFILKNFHQNWPKTYKFAKNGTHALYIHH